MRSAQVCTMCSAQILSCALGRNYVPCDLHGYYVPCALQRYCVPCALHRYCVPSVLHRYCVPCSAQVSCIMLCTGIVYLALHRYYVPCALHSYHVPRALLRYTCWPSCSSMVLVSTPFDPLFACLHFLSLTYRRLSVVSDDKQSLLTQ